MKRETVLKIVWPFLVGILVLVWVQAFKGTSPRRASEQPRDIAVLAGLESGASVFVTPKMPSQPKKSSYADWGRDPFVFSTETSQELVLGGIVWDPGQPAAIISGEIVVKGGAVGSYVVVEIQQDRVILNDGEKDIELRLRKEE